MSSRHTSTILLLPLCIKLTLGISVAKVVSAQGLVSLSYIIESLVMAIRILLVSNSNLISFSLLLLGFFTLST